MHVLEYNQFRCERNKNFENLFQNLIKILTI